jgi:hypothetical protein
VIGRLAKRLLPLRQPDRPRPNPGATFLLGVGCQKGGTSWLHDYLSSSPAADLGLVKEYHVWDEIDLRDADHRAAALEKMRASAEKERADGVESISRLRYRFHTDLDTYFDYFVEKLSRPGVTLTGDITPSYSGLSVERFAMIRDAFAARGIAVKVILLMRDPVERIWSAARMKLWGERTEARQDEGAERTGDETVVIRTYRSAATRHRTNYHLTIAALEEVFAPEDIHTEFYERLFTPEATAKICAFLGLPHLAPQFDKTVNTAPKAAPISEATARRVALAYADVYRFAVERYGRETIAELWPHLERSAV